MINFNTIKPFSLLIKPASADCNLRCRYCFYIDHLLEHLERPRMSTEVLEQMIHSYMDTDQNNNYSFGWQGGEPTLMGLDFFKKVVDLQLKYAQPNAVISNGLQTNGTLITDEIAKFFNEFKFLIGVSLDGPADIHDYYRRTVGGTKTHSLVLKGIEKLNKHNVEFNILVLVNDQSIQNAKRIYHYLVDNGFYYHQYIPCVEYEQNGSITNYSITGAQWGSFLLDIFDEWSREDINKVSIRHFDSIIEFLVTGNYNICYMNNNCCQYFVIEFDGGVYPCDFFVRDDLLLGNVMTGNWEDFLNSPKYQKFGAQKALWNTDCDKCTYLEYCHGDCLKIRNPYHRNPKMLSDLCKGWKKFYTLTLPKFKTISNMIKQGKREFNPNLLNTKRIGRNELCPCGSGKKYKNCCLR